MPFLNSWKKSVIFKSMTPKFVIHQKVNTFKCIVVFLIVKKNVLAVLILKLVVVQPLMGNQ